MKQPNRPRTPVSLVCVFNDADVLESCLERSVRAGAQSAPDTELIAIDNRAGAFPSAGAALNHGASLANNDVVAFVHQDVVLHSLPALEEVAAELLADPRIGILGAVGVDHRGRVVGRIRDRVVPIGEPAPRPRPVDTMDEVLFLLRRDDVARDPLSEDSRLAWHAYAVEYALRVRRAGRLAAVCDVPLTHHSMSTNLARLDVAHRTVGDAYGDLLPIRTTCGVVHGSDGPGGAYRVARRARGARRWWRESLQARGASRAAAAPVVLADIRMLIDDVAEVAGADAIRALDVDRGEGTPTAVDGLTRAGRRFSSATVSPSEVAAELARAPEGEIVLVSHLRPADLAALHCQAPHVVGLSWDTGLWLLAGVDPEAAAPLWSGRRNLPFAGLGRGGVSSPARPRVLAGR